MSSFYSSDSDNEPSYYHQSLYSRQRPLYDIFGGGKVADVLLWRNKNLSASILIGFTTIWFLFEVLGYNFITLLSQITILMMLFVFIWSYGAGFVDRSPPDFHIVTIPESTFKWLLDKTNWLLQKLYKISSGKDLTTFFLAITSLWVLSTIGNYFSSLNLLYIGFVCLATLPAMYQRYQYEVDRLVKQGKTDMKKLYMKLDSKFLNKIPRGPTS
ncbi:hypothetical protein M9H77_08414 [Catharanthus roseus]|uniref:Uncharacterized protein n=1 Tax=Catharanthus roseus TaxID=4058 RepID=A0ACC0BXR2_CATRO|nr:hypothetical protein M9H77_08414 [Catharanthus roseus]